MFASADIKFGFIVSNDIGKINNISFLAPTIQRAVRLLLAIAGFISYDGIVCYLCVVRFDNLRHVVHATMTDLYCVSVEYLVQFAFCVEMFVY